MRDLALTIVIFGLLPFCIMRPWIGVLTWHWLGIMNPHKLAFGFAAGFPFAMLVGAATLLGLLMTRERKAIPWNGALALMFLFFLYVTLTTIVAWALIAGGIAILAHGVLEIFARLEKVGHVGEP